MAQDLEQLEGWLNGLVEQLEPKQRRALASRVAIDLQRANAKREKANVEPDGKAMAPRRRQLQGAIRDRVAASKRAVKNLRMFLRAAGPRYLRRQISDGDVAVGFVGRMARIMRVHQYGLRDTVSHEPGAPEVSYTARQVIGFSDDDRRRIIDTVIAHLSE